MTEHRITLADRKWAREQFEKIEPRDLFYQAASKLAGLAFKDPTSPTEALAVLLKTWNKEYYRYRKFNAAHFADIERLLSDQEATLAKYRNRAIDDLDDQEQVEIVRLFNTFEIVLGAVGSAKALHLLAPGFFPLWDRAIAKEYGCGISFISLR